MGLHGFQRLQAPVKTLDGQEIRKNLTPNKRTPIYVFRFSIVGCFLLRLF